MKTFKDLLNIINACSEAREWAGDKSIEEVMDQCHRGDWLLWLGQKIDVGLQPLTLVKGHCANTVRHIMKDERSLKAVDAAIAFGEGKISREGLDAAAAAAYAAADAYVAAVAADAYVAAVAAAYAAADAYVAAVAADAYVAALDKSRMETADICRKYIGNLIIDKVNELLNK